MTVAVAIAGTTVTLCRYYNLYFIIGALLMTAGAEFILRLNINTSSAVCAIFECILGAGVGFLMLGNVMPCHTVVPEAEANHSTAQDLAFFYSMTGA